MAKLTESHPGQNTLTKDPEDEEKNRGGLGRVDLTVFSPISSQPCFCLVLSVSLLSSPLANASSLSAWKRLAKARNQPNFPTPISEPKQRPINISPGLCIKTRLSAQPLIWKLFFILMQMKLIFTRKAVHMTSF